MRKWLNQTSGRVSVTQVKTCSYLVATIAIYFEWLWVTQKIPQFDRTVPSSKPTTTPHFDLDCDLVRLHTVYLWIGNLHIVQFFLRTTHKIVCIINNFIVKIFISKSQSKSKILFEKGEVLSNWGIFCMTDSQPKYIVIVATR